MIWCEYCNKHMHCKHFADPAEAEREFLADGWGGGDCLTKRGNAAKKKKKKR